MGPKLLALVPSALPNLERFHADATDSPLLSVVVWTTHGSGRTRQLALDRECRRLLELQRVEPSEGSRSWFLGNSVVQNGSITLFSPMDPLFVLLDASWTQRKRFASVFDILAQNGSTWLLQLLSLDQNSVQRICDVQNVEGDGVGDMYVKVNEGKVTEWLKAKVEKLATVLASQEKTALKTAAFAEQVYVPGGKKEGGEVEVDVARYHREAIDMVGNYLPEEWIELLCKEFQVEKDVEVKTPAKAAAGGQDSFGRFDRRKTPESGSKRSTPASAAAAKKKSKLANVDRTGMKSLTSFFGKK